MSSTFSGQGKASRGVIHLHLTAVGAAACSSTGNRTVSIVGEAIITCTRCKAIVVKLKAPPIDECPSHPGQPRLNCDRCYEDDDT